MVVQTENLHCFSPFTDISNNERFAKRKDPNNNDIQWSVKDIGRFLIKDTQASDELNSDYSNNIDIPLQDEEKLDSQPLHKLLDSEPAFLDSVEITDNEANTKSHKNITYRVFSHDFKKWSGASISDSHVVSKTDSKILISPFDFEENSPHAKSIPDHDVYGIDMSDLSITVDSSTKVAELSGSNHKASCEGTYTINVNTAQYHKKHQLPTVKALNQNSINQMVFRKPHFPSLLQNKSVSLKCVIPTDPYLTNIDKRDVQSHISKLGEPRSLSKSPAIKTVPTGNKITDTKNKKTIGSVYDFQQHNHHKLPKNFVRHRKTREKTSKCGLFAIFFLGMYHQAKTRDHKKTSVPLCSSKLRICYSRADLEVPYEQTVESRVYHGYGQKGLKITKQETIDSVLDKYQLQKKISKFLNEGPETKSFGPVSLEQKINDYKRIAYKLLKAYIKRPVPVSLTGDIIPIEKLIKKRGSKAGREYSQTNYNDYKSKKNSKHKKKTRENSNSKNDDVSKQSKEINNETKNAEEWLKQIQHENEYIHMSFFKKSRPGTDSNISVSPTITNPAFPESNSLMLDHHVQLFGSEITEKNVENLNLEFLQIALNFLKHAHQVRQLQHNLAEIHQLRELLVNVKLQVSDYTQSQRHCANDTNQSRKKLQDASTGIQSVANFVVTHFRLLAHSKPSPELDLYRVETPCLAKNSVHLDKVLPNQIGQSPAFQLLLENAQKGKNVYEFIKQTDPFCFNGSLLKISDVNNIFVFQPQVDLPHLHRLVVSRQFVNRLCKENGKTLMGQGLKKLDKINQTIAQDNVQFESLKTIRAKFLNYIYTNGQKEMNFQ